MTDKSPFIELFNNVTGGISFRRVEELAPGWYGYFDAQGTFRFHELHEFGEFPPPQGAVTHLSPIDYDALRAAIPEKK